MGRLVLKAYRAEVEHILDDSEAVFLDVLLSRLQHCVSLKDALT